MMRKMFDKLCRCAWLLVAVLLLTSTLGVVAEEVAPEATANPINLYILVSDYNKDGSIIDLGLPFEKMINVVGRLEETVGIAELSVSTVQAETKTWTAEDGDKALWLYECLFEMKKSGDAMSENTGKKLTEALSVDNGNENVVLMLFGDDLNKINNSCKLGDGAEGRVYFLGPQITLAECIDDIVEFIAFESDDSAIAANIVGTRSEDYVPYVLSEPDQIAFSNLMKLCVVYATTDLNPLEMGTVTQVGDRYQVTVSADHFVNGTIWALDGIDNAVLIVREDTASPHDRAYNKLIAAFGLGDAQPIVDPTEPPVEPEVPAAEEAAEEVAEAPVAEEVVEAPIEEGADVTPAAEEGADVPAAAAVEMKIVVEGYQVSNAVTPEQDAAVTEANSNGFEVAMILQKSDVVPLSDTEPAPAFEVWSDVSEWTIDNAGRYRQILRINDLENGTVEEYLLDGFILSAPKPVIIKESGDLGGYINIEDAVVAVPTDLNTYFDASVPVTAFEVLTVNEDGEAVWADVNDVKTLPADTEGSAMTVRGISNKGVPSDELVFTWSLVDPATACSLTVSVEPSEDVVYGTELKATVAITYTEDAQNAKNFEDYKAIVVPSVTMVSGDDLTETVTEPDANGAYVFTAPGTYDRTTDFTAAYADAECTAAQVQIVNIEPLWKADATAEFTDLPISTLISKAPATFILTPGEWMDEATLEGNDGTYTLTVKAEGFVLTQDGEDPTYWRMVSSDKTDCEAIVWTQGEPAPVIEVKVDRLTETLFSFSSEGSIDLILSDAAMETEGTESTAIHTVTYAAKDTKFMIVVFGGAALVLLLILIIIIAIVRNARKPAFNNHPVTVTYTEDGITGTCELSAWGKDSITLLQLLLMAQMPPTNVVNPTELSKIRLEPTRDGVKIIGCKGDHKDGREAIIGTRDRGIIIKR